MDLIAALEVLGVAPGTPMDEARSRYRRQVRSAHPDVAGRGHRGAAHDRTALLTEAWAVVQAAGSTTIAPPPPPPPAAPPHDPPRWPPGAEGRPPGVGAVASDTIGVAAPPDEAFVVLHDAASRVGEISYVDRNLGIVEAIVRFEGGPSCSLLITLQGRAWGTEAFCTLESIEADPTPPITAVMEALLEALGV